MYQSAFFCDICEYEDVTPLSPHNLFGGRDGFVRKLDSLFVVSSELHGDNPAGDITGQMSAWYVFSSMGIYPVTHGTGLYFIGAPQKKHLSLEHAHGTLTVKARSG